MVKVGPSIPLKGKELQVKGKIQTVPNDNQVWYLTGRAIFRWLPKVSRQGQREVWLLPGLHHFFFNPGVPVFNMKINGKSCHALFNTGSTVNILGKNTLIKYLGIPDRFIQVKTGEVKAIKVITGQKISNLGNVQLSTELLGYKSVESFAVLPDTTFGADALIGYKTMRYWVLILDFKNEEVISNQR